MIDDALKAQLAAYLDRLARPVEITAWLDDSAGSRATAALLADIAAASPRVTVVPCADAAERKPSFAIHLPGEAPRVRFAGLPLGHELGSLVLALLHVGGHPPRASEDELARVRALDRPLRFETYFSTSCQSCPDVVQALNLLAALNPRVEHVAIDGALFPDEVAERQVMAVPAVFVNGERFGQGRMELGEILARIEAELGDTGASARRTDALDRKGVFDVLVVGGGPAGAAAAIYAARKGIATGLVAERFGGQVLDTLAIENFPSVVETEGPRFAAALEAHVATYPVDLVKHERVRRLVPGEVHALELESGATLRARTVVLAPGARWRNMNVPGEDLYRTRGVTYCPHCDGPLFKGKRVAVVGGGNSGVEAAIDLAGVVAHVTVLELADELRADAVLLRKLDSLANVDVILRARTTEVRGDGQRVTGLTWEDRITGASHHLDVEGVFVQIGLVPSTAWLRDTVELERSGEIVVDARGATSVPGVFAAGDATTVPFKQIVIATGDGAKAALSAFDHLVRTAP